MKIVSGNQNLEGSAQEISDLLEDHGLDLKQFFRTDEPPISNFWIILVGVLVLGSACALILLEPPQQRVAFVVGLFLILAWAILIQLRFKNGITTMIAGIGGIVLLLAALGVLTPLEVLKEAKELKPGKGP